MNISFNKNDLTDANILTIAQVINSAQNGGFMAVNGFKSKTGKGEIQNAIYCKGISYENAVSKSLEMLESIESNPNFSVTVKRGTWNDASGNENPTGRKSKAYSNYQVVTETYDRTSPVTEEALASIRKSLTNPAPVTKEYKKIGNGVYRDESGKVYIRDLRLVSKTVIVEGEKKEKATSAKVAIQNAIKSEMPVGNYRMFNLDGDFISIKLGGNEITQDMMKGEVEIPSESEKENA